MIRILAAAVLAGVAVGGARTLVHFAGLGAGAAVTTIEFDPDPNEAYWKLEANGRRPRVVLDAEAFRFGRMEVGTTGRHAFTVRNTGDYPLVLRKLESSCVCTLAELSSDAIAPGTSAAVILEWTTKPGARPGDPFRQWAEIETNDPDRREVTFTVEGELAGPLALEESEFSLGRIAASETRTVQTALWRYRDVKGDLSVPDVTWSDAATAGHFVVGLMELTVPADAARTSPVQHGATGGCEVEVTVKPGLPLGPFRQTIRLRTNLADVDPVELAIVGEVVPDVYVTGSGYSERSGVLALGGRPGAAVERTLHVMAFGARRGDVRLAVAEKRPNWLVVNIGEAEPAANGQAARIAVTIGISSNAPTPVPTTENAAEVPMVVLNTGHPDVPQVRIRVRP